MIGSFDDVMRDFKHGVYDFTKDGKCIECGACCSRFLPVTRKELNQIHRYIERNGIGKQEHGTAVISKDFIDMNCPFLDMSKPNKKCAIYEVRPLICRDFCCNKGKQASEELLKSACVLVDFSKEFFGEEIPNITF